jgi:hypothetical protein
MSKATRAAAIAAAAVQRTSPQPPLSPNPSVQGASTVLAAAQRSAARRHSFGSGEVAPLWPSQDNPDNLPSRRRSVTISGAKRRDSSAQRRESFSMDDMNILTPATKAAEDSPRTRRRSSSSASRLTYGPAQAPVQAPAQALT